MDVPNLDRAIIITDADSNERLVTEDLADLLDRLEPTARVLGCADELARVAEIPERGASYQRQRRVAAETGGDLVAVVDSAPPSCQSSSSSIVPW